MFENKSVDLLYFGASVHTRRIIYHELRHKAYTKVEVLSDCSRFHHSGSKVNDAILARRR